MALKQYQTGSRAVVHNIGTAVMPTALGLHPPAYDRANIPHNSTPSRVILLKYVFCPFLKNLTGQTFKRTKIA